MMILYVIFVISTCALIGIGIAMYVRVRRLARASDTQFCRALKDMPEFPGSGVSEPNRAPAETKAAP